MKRKRKVKNRSFLSIGGPNRACTRFQPALELLDERQLLAADLAVDVAERTPERDQVQVATVVTETKQAERQAEPSATETEDLRDQLQEEAVDALMHIEMERMRQQEDLSTNEEPAPNQVPVDPEAGEVDLAYDSIEGMDEYSSSQFLEEFERLMAEVVRVGGLDGRNDVSDGLGVPSDSRQPGSTGADALGGWQSGPGSSSDDDGKEPTTWEEIVEFFGGGDADKAEEQGSGQPGDKLGVGVGLGTNGAAAGEGVEALTKSHSPGVGGGAGKITGGILGSIITVLTANTDSPDSKQDEFRGWAAILGALFGKPPLAGSQSMDGETAEAVNGQETTVPTVDEVTQDRTQDQESLPGHLNDPSAGWGDEEEERRWDMGTGGGVTDPNPVVDSSVSYDGPPPTNDPTDFVADYSEPVYEMDNTPVPQDNRHWEY